MSNLDAQILTSFTRKLAAAAEKVAVGPAAMPQMNNFPAVFAGGLADGVRQMGEAALDFGREPKPRAEAKPMVPNVTTPPKPFSAPPEKPALQPATAAEADLGPDIKLPTGKEPPAKLDVRTRELIPSPAEIMAGPQPSPEDMLNNRKPSVELPPAAAGNSLYDSLMGALPYAGGAAAGGLGAMALARLFNSSKDDEEEESSWAPWLAGLGGAAAGAGAVHYRPQLLEMINALRSAGSEAAPAAPPAAAKA
jgi:hypothetical protein